jgi:hypothetical protein
MIRCPTFLPVDSSLVGEGCLRVDEVKMPKHAQWLKLLEREVAEEYQRLHADAREDMQRAGHGGESTWVRILEQWLPHSYRVVTRKYIVPEVGAGSAETDIVVLNPSYPDALAKREEILFGGVAAAFSVKLTLDAGGMRDAVTRAVDIRRGMATRYGTPREEMLAPFPVGLLAHSHDWKAPGSTPRDNVTKNLRALDNELVRHPRESLDFLCVADLGLWWTMRVPFMATHPAELITSATTGRASGVALSGIGQTEASGIYAPVASLVTHLIVRLSYSDPALASLAKSLRVMGTLGMSIGESRSWHLGDVYSDGARAQLMQQLFKQGYDFHGAAYF